MLEIHFLALWYIHQCKRNDMCHFDGISILKSMFYTYTLFVILLLAYLHHFLCS